MICINIDDLIHLVVNLIQKCEWEGILVGVVPATLALVIRADLSSFCLLLHRLVGAVKVHVRVVTSMTVALVVMNHSSSITGEKELVVLGELDASDPGFVIVDYVDRCFASLVELKDANLVVEIAAHV